MKINKLKESLSLIDRMEQHLTQTNTDKMLEEGLFPIMNKTNKNLCENPIFIYFELINEKYKNIHLLIENNINEEFGISEIVENYSDLIYKEIISNYKEHSITDKYGTIIYKGFVIPPKNLLNNPLTIEYELFEFKNLEDYNLKEELYDFNSHTNTQTHYVKIVGRIIGNKIEKTLGGVIQHELFHIFDNEISNKTEMSDSEQALYSKINKLLNNQYFSEDTKQFLTAIYYSFKNEQIAYTNSLDNLLKKSPELNPESTPYFEIIYTIEKVLNNFSKYKGFGLSFGKTDEWCYKRLHKAYNDYCRRFGRVIMRYKQSKIGKEIIK